MKTLKTILIAGMLGLCTAQAFAQTSINLCEQFILREGKTLDIASTQQLYGAQGESLSVVAECTGEIQRGQQVQQARLCLLKGYDRHDREILFVSHTIAGLLNPVFPITRNNRRYVEAQRNMVSNNVLGVKDITETKLRYIPSTGELTMTERFGSASHSVVFRLWEERFSGNFTCR
jgi:hypothetical protein